MAMLKRTKKKPTITASEVGVLLQLVATMDPDKIADTKDGAAIKAVIYKAQSFVQRTQTPTGWHTQVSDFDIVSD